MYTYSETKTLSTFYEIRALGEAMKRWHYRVTEGHARTIELKEECKYNAIQCNTNNTIQSLLFLLAVEDGDFYSWLNGTDVIKSAFWMLRFLLSLCPATMYAGWCCLGLTAWPSSHRTSEQRWIGSWITRLNHKPRWIRKASGCSKVSLELWC